MGTITKAELVSEFVFIEEAHWDVFFNLNNLPFAFLDTFLDNVVEHNRICISVRKLSASLQPRSSQLCVFRSVTLIQLIS